MVGFFMKIFRDKDFEYNFIRKESTESKFEALMELFALGFNIEYISDRSFQEQISTEELLEYTISVLI